MNLTILTTTSTSNAHLPQVWNDGISIAFYSGICGQIIMILLFMKLIYLWVKENSDLSVNNNNKNSLWLYINALGCILSSFIINLLTMIMHMIQIPFLTKNICQILQPLTGLSWAITRFFYYS